LAETHGAQRLDPVLARPDPGAATAGPDTVVSDLGERAAADPITGLQQRHGFARLLEPQGGRQPGKSRRNHVQIASKSRFVVFCWTHRYNSRYRLPGSRENGNAADVVRSLA